MTRDKATEFVDVVPRVRECLQQARPAIAAAIEAVCEPTCKRHVEEVRRSIAQARSLDDAAVLDDLPHVLHEMTTLFSRNDSLEGLAMLGPPHATARFGQNFGFVELLNEQMILGHHLRTQIENHLERPLERDESCALDAALQTLFTQTVASFAALRETQIRLEATAQSDFSSSLAHDLRNELNSAMTAITLLKETGCEFWNAVQTAPVPASLVPMAERARELSEDIEHCRQSLESTIASMTRMLEAERLRTDVKPHRRSVALPALLRGIIRSAARAHPSGQTGDDVAAPEDRVEVDCPSDTIIATDPDLLSTILANLIGNAFKHAPAGKVRVTVRSHESDVCRITVQDGGPGIPPEVMDNLFQKFVRREQARAGGFGLGLFIVRRAVSALGAHLEIESKAGQGTRFTVVLPRSEVTGRESERPPKQPPTPPPKPTP